MGTVVAETQGTLREIEQHLDRFFRNPADRSGLAGTGPMFDQVCGVLALLGYDEPVAALRNVQQAIVRYTDPAIEAEPDEFNRIAQNLGLTRRRDASWRTAQEITDVLRGLDPRDPVKYDFAICHLGVSRQCPSRRDEAKCERCVLRSVCVHWTGRR